MDSKQIIMLALQVSILATVFGFGLKARPGDLLYLWRQPGLLVRSLVTRRRRATEGCCRACGYDLRASIGRCPECGTAFGSNAGLTPLAKPL